MIERGGNLTEAMIDELLRFDQDKIEKRVINTGTGRTGLFRVGNYLVNAQGEIIAEPDELKR